MFVNSGKPRTPIPVMAALEVAVLVGCNELEAGASLLYLRDGRVQQGLKTYSVQSESDSGCSLSQRRYTDTRLCYN